jgi:hypothetical protein
LAWYFYRLLHPVITEEPDGSWQHTLSARIPAEKQDNHLAEKEWVLFEKFQVFLGKEFEQFHPALRVNRFRGFTAVLQGSYSYLAVVN